MRILPTLVLTTSLFTALPEIAHAADIARLEWGNFIVEDDTSDGWATYKYVPSDDGRSITMTFAPIEAKADGAVAEARSKLSGHYDVTQPKIDSFASIVVQVEGHVIKSGGSLTRLVLNIGSTEKTIEWATGEAASEKFERKIEIALPVEGRLPVPFMVNIEAYARKDSPSDAAYVSVETLSITAANAQVVSN